MKSFRPLVCLALGVAATAPTLALAQFVTPNVITTPGEVSRPLGGTVFVNRGLVGVGRISASKVDTFGETFGSVSGLQITNWRSTAAGSYAGTFHILPDRGYNNGNFFAAYAARIQQIDFTFTPYTGTATLGGADIVAQVAAQNQIAVAPTVVGTKLTYLDPTTQTALPTTGLDPAAGTALIFGKILPYVVNYTGNQAPSSTGTTLYPGINRLPIDAEALALRADGSGYIGDEYAANIYHFDAAKRIIGVITPPAAIQPHSPVGTLNFNSTGAPMNGRRNNQGLEGVALSPKGTTLFALLQSAATQDTSSANQTRLHTRLLAYDVSGAALPTAPKAEYVLTLPTFRQNGDGNAVNATAAQSEIVALDETRVLVLSRDGNGLGTVATNPSMFKSVLLVDTTIGTTGTPTNIAGTAADAEGGKVTTAPGVLDPAITPLASAEVVNLLNSTQLNKFHLQLDAGGTAQVSKLTLGEKWEGLSLVPVNDPAAPNDYFLFVANDNDFITSDGRMVGPDGTIVTYNAFATGYAPNRIPAPVAPSTASENDTVFLAYRVTITPGADQPPVAPVVVAPTLPPPSSRPPTLRVSGPKKATAKAPAYVVRGVALGVGRVEVRVNGGRYRPAKGDARWSFRAELRPGRNVLLIRTVSPDGVASAPEKRIVTLP